MFTGLVETTAEVAAVERRGSAARLVLVEPTMAAEIEPGASVCVSGACLTASELAGDRMAFDVVGETLERTTLGALGPGARVNLERALELGDRLDGHLVQGHVDGVGTVAAVETAGEWRRVRFDVDRKLAALVVEKGSAAVDGVSLTITDVSDAGFSVALVPVTLERTTLGALATGARVNVETDLIGKYVARLLAAGGGAGSGLSLETLRREGFA